MDYFSQSLQFPSKPDGYKNTYSSQPKTSNTTTSSSNKKIDYTGYCNIN
jgi:hypothetical protein